MEPTPVRCPHCRKKQDEPCPTRCGCGQSLLAVIAERERRLADAAQSKLTTPVRRGAERIGSLPAGAGAGSRVDSDNDW